MERLGRMNITLNEIDNRLDKTEQAMNQYEHTLIQKGVEIKRVAELVERLKTENAELKTENARLIRQNENIRKQCIKLLEENTNIKEQNTNLKDQNANLKGQNNNSVAKNESVSVNECVPVIDFPEHFKNMHSFIALKHTLIIKKKLQALRYALELVNVAIEENNEHRTAQGKAECELIRQHLLKKISELTMFGEPKMVP